LSGEKNAITRRLREIDNELVNKKEMLDRVELILLEDKIDDFIHEHAEEILIDEKPIKEIIEEDGADLTEDELGPYITKLREIYEHLTTLIEKIDENYTLPNSFDNFAKDNDIKIDDRKDWYELVYRIIWDVIPDDAYSSPLLGFKPMLSTNSLMRSLSKVPMQIHRDRVKERNKLEDEVQIITGIKKEHEKILRSYGNVSGLWSGLAVLIYACVVGIVIPSTLLPYPLEIYNDVATKQFLLALFYSELVVLFIYLGVSMYKLTNEK